VDAETGLAVGGACVGDVESSTVTAVSVGRRETSCGSSRRQQVTRDECDDLNTATPVSSN